MATKYLKLIHKINVGIASLTSFLVLVFALFIVVPMFTSNPLEEYGTGLEASRGPASVVSLRTDLTSLSTLDREMLTIDVECVSDGTKKVITSQAKQIRVVGKWCGSGAGKMSSSSVINRTNGLEATMFNLRQGKFTSDYISLEKGENQILVRVTSGEDNKRLSELVVNRQ